MPAEIALREVVAGDLPTFFEQQRDPDANRMAAFPARDRDTFMAHWEKILRDPAIRYRTILWRGQVAGNVVCFEQAGRRLVGYWLGKEYWGRGIATRALSLYLRLETERPLYAYVARHNVASRRVLEKCGFEPWPDDAAAAPTAGGTVDEILMRLGGEAQTPAEEVDRG
jgi:RimJ/RimL family protein N-acetyltransferase